MKEYNRIIHSSEVLQYTRKTARRVWCGGCGHGIALGALIRSIIQLGIPKEKIANVSGIGCIGRVAAYVDWDSIQTPHGRTIPVATGIKLARPDLNVIVFSGDGDIISIGGNHFIHAARRNINLTVIIASNYTYGMTGGQIAPTTPFGDISATTPYGSIEYPMDICEVAIACGATYVARSTTYHVNRLISYIKKGIQNKGFSVIEVISQCPTQYGKVNKKGNASAMLQYMKNNTVKFKESDRYQAFESQNSIVIGEFCSRERSELTDNYKKLIAKVRDAGI